MAEASAEHTLDMGVGEEECGTQISKAAPEAKPGITTDTCDVRGRGTGTCVFWKDWGCGMGGRGCGRKGKAHMGHRGCSVEPSGWEWRFVFSFSHG